MLQFGMFKTLSFHLCVYVYLTTGFLRHELPIRLAHRIEDLGEPHRDNYNASTITTYLPVINFFLLRNFRTRP